MASQNEWVLILCFCVPLLISKEKIRMCVIVCFATPALLQGPLSQAA